MITVLVLNAGSSSLKACLYRLAPEIAAIAIAPPDPLWQGLLDWGQNPTAAHLKVTTIDQRYEANLTHPEGGIASLRDWLKTLLETLTSGSTQLLESLGEITMIGHRVVHGGSRYQAPVRVDAQVKAVIRELSEYAPLHNPANLLGMELMAEICPQTPQVAVFDTAFHAQLPAVARTYAIPYELTISGIQRYGFHGISHQYVSERAAALLQRPLAGLRLITCHLGNGCSLTAVKGGISVETTMGFTPTAGVMMGTRCGDIDPGILLYLLRRGKTIEELDRLVNRQSGLLGVSGVSNDLRQILAAIDRGNTQARLAYDCFIYSLQRGIASLLPSLGGLDALVFTAGIGENAPPVRRDVCRGLGWLGIELDSAANEQGAGDRDLASADAPVRVLVVHTQEDWAIARACVKFLHPPNFA
ncbi:MAG: acetate kinase [Thermosynechococcus sp. Uc]|uniref:acetate/propionate family kinase n=1 Tax=Thermosynechococcus sp. Uc TaxID=3034853 RepID=UPI00259DBF39|nr:acetate kinase [Thermosynechococcus sp. Uc]MDM7327270.1 acetate kinase [Thermosynechococcus sp. Uc]